MLNLIVMSKQQDLIRSFLESLFATTPEGAVQVYVLNKALHLPNDPRVRNVYMDEFKPNYYFNKLFKVIPEGVDEYIGIVNDDILFADGWYEDVMEKLKDHNFVSPGFIETRDTSEFKEAIKDTKNKRGTYDGIFDAFYCFPHFATREIELDEDVVEWYDLDFLMEMLNHRLYPVTSRKVTVMHLGRMTLDNKDKFKSKVKKEIVDKRGAWGLRIARTHARDIRREFGYV